MPPAEQSRASPMASGRKDNCSACSAVMTFRVKSVAPICGLAGRMAHQLCPVNGQSTHATSTPALLRTVVASLSERDKRAPGTA